MSPIVSSFGQTNDDAGDLRKEIEGRQVPFSVPQFLKPREQSAGGLFKFILQLPRWLVGWAQKPNGKQQTNTDNYK